MLQNSVWVLFEYYFLLICKFRWSETGDNKILLWPSTRLLVLAMAIVYVNSMGLVSFQLFIPVFWTAFNFLPRVCQCDLSFPWLRHMCQIKLLILPNWAYLGVIICLLIWYLWLTICVINYFPICLGIFLFTATVTVAIVSGMRHMHLNNYYMYYFRHAEHLQSFGKIRFLNLIVCQLPK